MSRVKEDPLAPLVSVKLKTSLAGIAGKKDTVIKNAKMMWFASITK